MNIKYSVTAQFETQNAERYIAQLCKHFAHKVDVKYSERKGRAYLPGSHAFMENKKNKLILTVTSDTEPGLENGKFIIEDHILRFAFREKLEKLEWHSAIHMPEWTD